MDINNIPFDAKTGDTVVVTSTNLTVTSAFIGLATPQQWDQCHASIESDDINVLIPTTARDSASREQSTVEFKVPSNGKWHILYSPDQVGDIKVAIRKSTT